MIGPRVPFKVVERTAGAAAGVVDALARLPVVERVLTARLRSVEGKLDRLHEAIRDLEPLLREENESSDALRDELRANKAVLERAVEHLAAVRAAVEPLPSELAEVRGVVELLEPAADRFGRVSERLPGARRRSS